MENRHATAELHKQTKSETLATRRESHLTVMAFTYRREMEYIYKSTRNTRRSDDQITHGRPTLASYNRNVKSMVAPIWTEQLSTTRNLKSTEAYRKHILKTNKPTPGNKVKHSH